MPGESQARRRGQVDGPEDVHRVRASTEHARSRSIQLLMSARGQGPRHTYIAYLYTPPRPQWPLSPSMVCLLVLSIPLWVGDAHHVRYCALDTFQFYWGSGCRRTPSPLCIGARWLDAARRIDMGSLGAPAPSHTYSSLKTPPGGSRLGDVPPTLLRGVRPGDSVPGHPRLFAGCLRPGFEREGLRHDAAAAAASCLSYSYSGGCHPPTPPL